VKNNIRNALKSSMQLLNVVSLLFTYELGSKAFSWFRETDFQHLLNYWVHRPLPKQFLHRNCM